MVIGVGDQEVVEHAVELFLGDHAHVVPELLSEPLIAGEVSPGYVVYVVQWPPYLASFHELLDTKGG